MAEKIKTENVKVKDATYTKEQLLQSKRFENKRDLVSAVIEDGEDLTLAQVDAKIDSFLRKKVK